MDKKPLWWNFLLVILATLYLIPEAIFNSQLVSLVGKGTPSTEDLEKLELFGRSISGIGVTLLFADFLKTKWVTNKFKALFSLACLFTIVVPLMFYGQKFLIEEFLIKSSTAEQRQQAVFSTALRDALAINAVKINGVDFDKEAAQSPENLTFLSLFGGLLYADSNLSGTLGDNKQKIINKFVKQKAYNNFEQYYKDYDELYNELTTSYKEYAKGSKKYNDVILDIPNREMEYWTQIEDDVNKGYKKYIQAQKAHIAKASARAQKYGNKIYDYFERKAKCRKSYKKNKERRYKCIDRLNQKYRIEIKKVGIGYIEPDYWLIVEEVSTTENITKTILGGLLTGGILTGLQALNKVSGGDGGFTDKRYKYTSYPEHYRNRILSHPNFIKMFEKETGYSFFINDLVSFRINTETQKRIIAKFKKKNLKLSNTWTINKRTEFTIAVSKKVKKDALQEWNRAVNKKSFTFKPNLRWVDFQLHKEIQLKIEERMGDMYIKNIRADWNKKNFKINVLEPNIKKKTKFYLDAVNSSTVHFENGGKYELYGKQALRSVIVPPISMFLSLFLICLTLSKLPTKYYSLIVYNKKKKKDTKLSKNISISIKILIPVLILLLPPLIVKNIYTEDKDSTVNYFLDKVNDKANFVFSYAIRWTLHAQPILHPLGTNFEEYSGIYVSFDQYSHILHKIDFDFAKNSKLSKEDERNKNLILKNLLQLKINAPKGSRIQIMSIKPKYKDDIILKTGNHDIKITLPTGKIIRKWYSFNAGYKVLDFTK